LQASDNTGFEHIGFIVKQLRGSDWDF